MAWQLVGKGTDILGRVDAQRPTLRHDLQGCASVDAGWLLSRAMEFGDGPKCTEAPAGRWVSNVAAQHRVKVHCLVWTDILVGLPVLYCHNSCPLLRQRLGRLVKDRQYPFDIGFDRIPI